MNDLDFEGRSAIVTGGAKGIGYATAERMLDSGARLCLWDIDEPRLTEAEATLSAKGEVHGITVDVADAGAVASALEATLDVCPVIDVMIANAGIAGIIKDAWDYSLEEWNRMLRADLTSVFLSCRALVPHMIARGYGRIVVIASIAGMEGAQTNAAYAAAKAGAIAYTKALGKELAKTGVIANCVAPSAIDTEMLGDVTQEYLEKVVLSKMPIGRPGRPEEAAALIAWLASEDCSFCAGAVFDLSGGRAVY
ncbi:MAG: SDR family NAD(P)-dependent oxidoreductase [Kiloniellales bacterium]